MGDRSGGIRVDDVHEHAARLVRSPVRLADLALAFDESAATSAEVLVESRNFYPPMLSDVASTVSSVYINQFGFRPGTIGDELAEALLAKAAEGVPVRVVVDRQGSDPDRASRAFFERLLAGGVDVRVVRAVELRAPAQPAVVGAPTARTSSQGPATSRRGA